MGKFGVFVSIVAILVTVFLYFGFQTGSDANLSHVGVQIDDKNQRYYWIYFWNNGTDDAKDIEVYYALYRFPVQTDDGFKLPGPPVYGKFDFSKYNGSKNIPAGDARRYGFTHFLTFKPLYINFCVSRSDGSPLRKVWYHFIHKQTAGAQPVNPGPDYPVDFPGWQPRFESYVRPAWSSPPCPMDADPGLYELYGIEEPPKW